MSDAATADVANRLTEAATALDTAAVSTLTDELVDRLRCAPGTFSPAEAAAVLGSLRRKRLFTSVMRVADALIESGCESPMIDCQYAQALIDHGLPSAAEALLVRTRQSAPDDPVVLSEIDGLLGRAYKQMYVQTGPGPRRRVLLEQALTAYRRAADSTGWGRINVVALCRRAERDGVSIPSCPDWRQSAEALAAGVASSFRDPAAGLGAWDYAVAAEACLALDRAEEALTWLERYAADPRVDSFELLGTLRQFTEVWQLTPDREAGAVLLPVLKARILDCGDGGDVPLADSDLQEASEPAGLQKLLGRDGIVTYRWYRNGLIRSRAVAHIADRNDNPVGTGFIVRGADLHPRFEEDLLLVTNAHVLGDPSKTEGALEPGQAVVTFQAGPTGEQAVAEVLWSSPPSELDAVVARLTGPAPDIEPCPLTTALPRLDGKQRVYVIGHPQGRSLSFSIADNVLLDYDDRLVQYRAPTEPGSSGSPVFNRDWDVIAVHHAGRHNMPRLHGRAGTHPANEGIWVGAIQDALKED